MVIGLLSDGMPDISASKALATAIAMVLVAIALQLCILEMCCADVLCAVVIYASSGNRFAERGQANSCGMVLLSLPARLPVLVVASRGGEMGKPWRRDGAVVGVLQPGDSWEAMPVAVATVLVVVATAIAMAQQW